MSKSWKSQKKSAKFIFTLKEHVFQTEINKVGYTNLTQYITRKTALHKVSIKSPAYSNPLIYHPNSFWRTVQLRSYLRFPNILYVTLFSNTRNVCISSRCEISFTRKQDCDLVVRWSCYWLPVKWIHRHGSLSTWMWNSNFVPKIN